MIIFRPFGCVPFPICPLMNRSCVSNMLSPSLVVFAVIFGVHLELHLVHHASTDDSLRAFSQSRAANDPIATPYVHSMLLLHIHNLDFSFPLLQTCAFWISVQRTRHASTGFLRIRVTITSNHASILCVHHDGIPVFSVLPHLSESAVLVQKQVWIEVWIGSASFFFSHPFPTSSCFLFLAHTHSYILSAGFAFRNPISDSTRLPAKFAAAEFQRCSGCNNTYYRPSFPMSHSCMPVQGFFKPGQSMRPISK
jgi:hypothetical protein